MTVVQLSNDSGLSKWQNVLSNTTCLAIIQKFIINENAYFAVICGRIAMCIYMYYEHIEEQARNSVGCI